MTVDGFGFGTLTGESCLKNVHSHTDRASWDAILVTVVAFGALMWKKSAQSHRFGLGRVGGGDTNGGWGPANREPHICSRVPGLHPHGIPPPLPAPGPQPPGRPCSQRSRAQTRGREDDGAGSARRKEQHHNGNEHVTMTLLLTSGSNHTMSL